MSLHKIEVWSAEPCEKLRAVLGVISTDHLDQKSAEGWSLKIAQDFILKYPADSGWWQLSSYLDKILWAGLNLSRFVRYKRERFKSAASPEADGRGVTIAVKVSVSRATLPLVLKAEVDQNSFVTREWEEAEASSLASLEKDLADTTEEIKAYRIYWRTTEYFLTAPFDNKISEIWTVLNAREAGKDPGSPGELSSFLTEVEAREYARMLLDEKIAAEFDKAGQWQHEDLSLQRGHRQDITTSQMYDNIQIEYKEQGYPSMAEVAKVSYDHYTVKRSVGVRAEVDAEQRVLSYELVARGDMNVLVKEALPQRLHRTFIAGLWHKGFNWVGA